MRFKSRVRCTHHHHSIRFFRRTTISIFTVVILLVLHDDYDQFSIKNNVVAFKQLFPTRTANTSVSLKERELFVNDIDNSTGYNNQKNNVLRRSNKKDKILFGQQNFVTKRRNWIYACVLTGSYVGIRPKSVNAFPGSTRQRAQIDYCLVNILRLKYWVQHLVVDLGISLSDDDNNNVDQTQSAKTLFLEARLGCKAALTQKVGGGANINVYTLSQLHIKDCLNDSIDWYIDQVLVSNKEEKKVKTRKKREIQDIVDDIYYYLGSVVEFDGFESLTDTSPRSSLTLQMYNKEKGIFVKRTFEEKLLPTIDTYLKLFEPQLIKKCQLYVKQFYPNEYYDQT